MPNKTAYRPVETSLVIEADLAAPFFKICFICLSPSPIASGEYKWNFVMRTGQRSVGAAELQNWQTRQGDNSEAGFCVLWVCVKNPQPIPADPKATEKGKGVTLQQKLETITFARVVPHVSFEGRGTAVPPKPEKKALSKALA
ncbi:hypothetical protein BaRGS_00009068 [Batillaria attramentaria]|uniref:Uncharacterized protein n=1 Tax=Batillaria attramentaria TaxID=370345 RepID=A0ABD0LJN1_9CAEN